MTEERVKELLHTMTSREFYNAAGINAEENKLNKYAKYTEPVHLKPVLLTMLEYLDDIKHGVTGQDKEELAEAKRSVERIMKGLGMSQCRCGQLFDGAGLYCSSYCMGKFEGKK